MIDSDIATGGDELVYFPSGCNEGANILGGKGCSLVRLSQLDLNVPSGAILTRYFFAPWYQQIRSGNTWQSLANNNNPDWESLANGLIAQAKLLTFSPQQVAVIKSLRKKLTTDFPGQQFAVRSSAPDEDSEGASFAGGYETLLGVMLDGVEQAIKTCFLSSLSARAFAYKQQQGLDYLSPAFAVVIQCQINSEAAGVGFSLNPINNDYDEVLINANWGLGESVVAGEVSPDQFVVDKVNDGILSKQLGKKEVSHLLSNKGEIQLNSDYRSNEFSLSDDQVKELSATIKRIEDEYAKPVDVEWALFKGELFILQARPITTYVPLPTVMQTKPGDRRRLYSDIMLADGYTLSVPASPLEMSCARDMFAQLEERLSMQNQPPEHRFIFDEGGRAYFNMSLLLRWASPKRLMKANKGTNELLSQIIAGLDRDFYKAQSKPPWSGKLLRFCLKSLWQLKGAFLFKPLGLIFGRQDKYKPILERVYAIEAQSRQAFDESLGLRECRRLAFERVLRGMFGPTGTLLMAFVIAQGLIFKIVGNKPEQKLKANQLLQGIPDNVVVQMGIALHRVASHLQLSDFNDINQLAGNINARRIPASFLKDWDSFIARFGSRGPNEMDCASPRFGDDIKLALNNVRAMVTAGNTDSPELILQRQIEQRHQTYRELMKKYGWFRRYLLRRCFNVIDTFAGIRDAPKYQVVLATYAFKKRALLEGQKLVAKGRLDQAEQIFGLRLDDIEQALLHPTIDLRQLYQQRTAFYRQQKRQIKFFPAIIDSRGRIPKPVIEENGSVECDPGYLRGLGVSSGVARGPVKILTLPDDKCLEPGDILVTYNTDPGWTPLFINAAAIVLEIGGILQHGAVVAREYGKPCVVGIHQVATTLKDGQIVEVNGDTGLIKLIDS